MLKIELVTQNECEKELKAKVIYVRIPLPFSLVGHIKYIWNNSSKLWQSFSVPPLKVGALSLTLCSEFSLNPS